MQARPRVIYWNNNPAPYMVDRFNALADLDLFDFEVWFNDRTVGRRSWHVDESTWRFDYRYIPSISVGRLKLYAPVLALTRRRPDLVLSLYRDVPFICGWFISRWLGVATGFRVLTTFDRWVKRHPLKEWLKQYMFSRVDVVESPGPDGMEYAARYGVEKEKVHFATHTVDVQNLMEGVQEAIPSLTSLRADLGLSGVTFLYVGRLWSGKGIFHLLQAFHKVQRASLQEVSLLLVGDGPDELVLRQQCDELQIKNVVFAGFKQRKELPTYYALADVFVFPTLGDPYGLVVDEAMVCSLPVISTSAAGEIQQRVEDGVNGFVVPCEDSRELSNRMLSLAQDEQLRKRMGSAAVERAKNHTAENWARDFADLVHKTLKRSTSK